MVRIGEAGGRDFERLAAPPRDALHVVRECLMRKTTTAVAGERIEYGCFVIVARNIAHCDPEGRGEGGLATRPADAGTRTAYEPGETVTVLTEGGALGQFGKTLRWAEIRDGRLLPADFYGSR